MTPRIKTNKAHWSMALEFAFHVLVAATMFLVVAAVAIAMRFLRPLLDVSPPVSYILTFAEYALLLLDAALFIVFVVRSAAAAFSTFSTSKELTSTSSDSAP